MARGTVTRYSEAFKAQVVSDVEDGKLSISEVRRKYGITGNATVQGWLKKYGKGALLPRRVRIEKMNEVDRIKALERQIEGLQKALAETQLENVCLKSMIDIHDEQHGSNLKKNPGYRALTEFETRSEPQRRNGR